MVVGLREVVCHTAVRFRKLSKGMGGGGRSSRSFRTDWRHAPRQNDGDCRTAQSKNGCCKLNRSGIPSVVHPDKEKNTMASMERTDFAAIRCLLLLAVLTVVFPAFAVQTELQAGTATYYLHTNTVGGQCTVTLLPNGSVNVECVDGDDVAAANSVSGCTNSAGRGYCAKDFPPPTQAMSGSQLNCENDSYNMHSGVEGENNCQVESGSSKRCESNKGDSYAEATCENGCGNSAGSGCCCKVGTAGCGTGPECNNMGE